MKNVTQETKMRIAIGAGVVAMIAIAMLAGGSKNGSAVRNDSRGNGAAVSDSTGPGTGTDISPVLRVVTYQLRSTSPAGQRGTVTLTDLGGNKTRVTISLTAASKNATQPANIHAGTCKDQAKEPQYALQPVVNGRSVTDLDVSIGALTDKSPQSVRVRTDAVTPNLPYAVCGELK
ncbi:MAG: hypothetical protein RLZZ324_1035 [Candidatus Parcubacteria bacterium]|jgi:hypothetical protein